MSNTTTIQVPIELNSRIRHLADQKSKELGLSTSLSIKAYLEMLTLQEELKNAANE